MGSGSTVNRTERPTRRRYRGSRCLQIHSAQTARTLRQESAGGGRGLFATILAFSYEPSRAPRASSFSSQSGNDEEPGRKHKIWQTPGFRSPRQVRRNDFDGSQWMADLYAFGGVLLRIDQ